MPYWFGVISAALSFILWGVLPIYWKQLQHVPAEQILLHRSLWSALLLLPLFCGPGKLRIAWQSLQTPRALLSAIASSFLISSNWFIFIWAVNTGHLLESSLGYFIAPLLSAALGVFVFKEALSPFKVVAFLLASLAVGYLCMSGGNFPWIALLLATTFSLYGLIHKLSKRTGLQGLALDLLIMLPLVGVYLFYDQTRAVNNFLSYSGNTQALLVLAGPVTVLPLLFYIIGAKRIQMSTLGILQYVSPSLQYLLALFVYHEHKTPAFQLAFPVIWVAVVIYVLDSLRIYRRMSVRQVVQV